MKPDTKRLIGFVSGMGAGYYINYAEFDGQYPITCTVLSVAIASIIVGLDVVEKYLQAAENRAIEAEFAAKMEERDRKDFEAGFYSD